MLGEKIAYAAVSPHLYILSYIHVYCYLPLWHLHSNFGDFNHGLCCVKKITIAENNHDIEFLKQYFALAPMLW